MPNNERLSGTWAAKYIADRTVKYAVCNSCKRIKLQKNVVKTQNNRILCKDCWFKHGEALT